jgi:hypothetical protein
MIGYHKNNEIDREQWDNCIKKTHRAKPYAYSWYLDIMAPGWEALVDDDYDSVFPIPGFRKLGIQYVSTPMFLQQLGAFSPDKSSPGALEEFLDFMPEFYKYIDLCVGQEAEHEEFKVTERDNFELDLSKHYDDLWDNFSVDCKRNIEAAHRRKPEIVTDIRPDELTSLFLRYRDNSSGRAKIVDIQRLKNLMNFCIKNKKGKILGVRTTGKRLLFGIFMIETHGNKTLLLIAGSPEADQRHLGYHVINEVIKTYAGTRTTLDFAGTSVPFVDSFMESFGCADIPYFRIFRNRLLWPARILK